MENLKKIMLVDDDPSITSFMKLKLEKTGKFTVVYTNKSKEALKLAKEEKPDLIISDIEMPGMDGGDFARAVLDTEELKNIPILFSSTLVMPSDVKDGMVGKRHMVSKSSPFNEVLAKIDSMLAAQKV